MEFLTNLTDEIYLFAFLFFAQLLTAECGYRIGRRTHALSDGSTSHMGALHAAVLGLLALLLSFTFSMAASRYDARKLLLVEEVNAIGTAALRGALLPAPHNANVQALFRKYMDARVAFFTSGVDEAKFKHASDDTETTQRALWAETVAAAQKDPHAIPTGLFIQALNEVIDLHTKQLAALKNRIPISIFLLLFFVAIVSAGLTGYAASATPGRNLFPTWMLMLLVTSVFVLIVDLHRPRRGFIRISADMIIQLRDTLNQQASTITRG